MLPHGSQNWQLISPHCLTSNALAYFTKLHITPKKFVKIHSLFRSTVMKGFFSLGFQGKCILVISHGAAKPK